MQNATKKYPNVCMFTRTRDDNWIYKWQLLNHMQGVCLVLLTPRWFTCFYVKSIFVLLLLLFCSICAQSSFVTRETLMRICRVKWETKSNTSHSAGNYTRCVLKTSLQRLCLLPKCKSAKLILNFKEKKGGWVGGPAFMPNCHSRDCKSLIGNSAPVVASE